MIDDSNSSWLTPKNPEFSGILDEAFNRPYKLVNEVNKHFRNASLMNTKKDLGKVVTV
jgi:HTH-type transcriptional regulator/antitoxin HigA